MSNSRNHAARALRWIGKTRGSMGQSELAVLEQVENRGALTAHLHDRPDQSTFGQRLADRVATFGGSWRFIMIFGGLLIAWTLLNTELLGKTAFDPYPYVFLNLLLSMMAAFQAPVIMMSQNRQSTRDRQVAENDYAVNLKAEIEIMALHEKFDGMRIEQVTALLEQQRLQIERLSQLIEQRMPAA